MPPMPPGFGGPSSPDTVNKRSIKSKKTNEFKKKLSDIKGCNSLPPMIIFLPPPMEKDLIICRNEYYKPSKEKAQKLISKMVGKNVKIKSISIEEGFREVYKVKYSTKYLIMEKDFIKYCNSALTKCLK
jgi:hypothetical protein